ncbi:hypothetical protein JTF06_05720 [Desemzia sp. RIT804]|uniref:hypothetical protein n=1 Tax=Desemzia sp. RIT 804 TaxID=2810209 RepID=UPI00194F9FDB|nr:hypothetical protein [Desemzia sp. RIT 804]MBM6614384.1 hypothetical protein [Desemzia sp. RIT 804]
MLDTILFFGYFVTYLILLIWAIKLAVHHDWSTLSNSLLLVIIGLVYDNGVLALGRFIGEGALLENLSYPRFYMHALFTPLLVLFSLSTLKRANVQWVVKKWIKVVFYFITLYLILYELLIEMRGLTLLPNWQYGVLSYSNSQTSSGVPLMVIIVSIVLIISSIFVWRKQRWIWFFIGTVIMFLGNTFPISVPSAALTNAFELILIFALFFTKKFQDNHLSTQKKY